MDRKILTSLLLVGLVIAPDLGKRPFGNVSAAQAPQTRPGGVPSAATALRAPDGMPTFQVDPSWPKLPAKWKLGDVSSVAVDAQDHVWILHRPRTLSADQSTMAAPPVLEFDAAGNFIQGWGGPAEGYEWPEREHGIHVDYKGNVWLGGNNCAARKLPGLKPVSDDQLLKFTKTGKLVMQIGRSNMSRGNGDTKNLHEPADAFVYQKTNEVFVADGYGNHRVIVLDADTGAFKRMWGAFGEKPVDSDVCPPPTGASIKDAGGEGPQQFAIVHAARVSKDGFVYVGDRENKRVQVFTIDGKFVTQVFIGRNTPGATATAGCVAFSPDPQERFLYVSGNSQIAVLNRKTLEILGSFGGASAHHIAVDSKGNIYTAETGQRRAQKFLFKGLS